jgi:hypothetical protein
MTKFLRNNYDLAHLGKGLLSYIKNVTRRCERCPEVFIREYNKANVYCGYLNQSGKVLRESRKIKKGVFVPLI